MIQEELVNVAVPRSRLAEVYALLGSPSRMTVTATPAEPASDDGWTEDLINRAYRESAERMRQVFDHLMDHPDEWVSAKQLASVLGVKQTQMRGVLGGFGHRKHSRYGLDQWPCDTRWDDQESTSFFRMSTGQAAVFQRARSLA